ncbi:hypothetical protein [Paenibacillus tianjinensis]|uniref:Uncharacterized protein n=1 Tax=Paenibacillus tianjinensis TaxID=2810347 RepID=A0ABX7LGI5_9BACL|nr:hypothetical protein [Paenibacillus tianjinensis]QSF47091.1 hypothetical protein JRJ22_11270 [Paenibacillus tianjinensis]
MNSSIKRMTAFAAAVMLSLTPAAVFAENSSGSTPVPSADSVQSGQEQPSHPHHARGFRAGGPFILSETAKLLDMDRAELMNSLKSGQSLYSLAKEKKGWSEDQYIQKLSDAASQKLDESIQDGQLTKDEVKKLKAGLPALLKLSISNATNAHKGKPSEQPLKTK